VSVSAVLDAARRELGVCENPHGSNRTRYGAEFGWDGVAWCAIWTWWVLDRAGCGALIPKTASTVVMRDWFLERRQWHTDNPQPGDLVFFRFPGNHNPVNHVGIVEAVEPGGSLVTIEGNTAGTNTADQRNGGGVYRKRRLSSIVGFARPAYPVAPPPPAPPRVREDDCMYIKTQPDKGNPDLVWTALLSGPMFVGLGPSEAPTTEEIEQMGGLVQWVEPHTWMDIDQRSRNLCASPRPVVTVNSPAA
jgi:hypothetical protein